jgi:hypothetical protein
LRLRIPDTDARLAQQTGDDFALVVSFDQHEFPALRALHGEDVHDFLTTKDTKEHE